MILITYVIVHNTVRVVILVGDGVGEEMQLFVWGLGFLEVMIMILYACCHVLFQKDKNTFSKKSQ